MDKLINAHIDDLEELERQLEIIIRQEIAQIDVASMIESPGIELARCAANIRRIFLDEYADEAVEYGFDFGRKINKRIAAQKTVKIDDSKDAGLNDRS